MSIETTSHPKTLTVFELARENMEELVSEEPNVSVFVDASGNIVVTHPSKRGGNRLSTISLTRLDSNHRLLTLTSYRFPDNSTVGLPLLTGASTIIDHLTASGPALFLKKTPDAYTSDDEYLFQGDLVFKRLCQDVQVGVRMLSNAFDLAFEDYRQYRDRVRFLTRFDHREMGIYMAHLGVPGTGYGLADGRVVIPGKYFR